jgi:hypothetical protein
VGIESYHELCPIKIYKLAITIYFQLLRSARVYTKTTEKNPIKHLVKLVDSSAETADCTSIDESPGKAYVEVGLINPSAFLVMMLKRIFLK